MNLVDSFVCLFNSFTKIIIIFNLNYTLDLLTSKSCICRFKFPAIYYIYTVIHSGKFSQVTARDRFGHCLPDGGSYCNSSGIRVL